MIVSGHGCVIGIAQKKIVGDGEAHTLPGGASLIVHGNGEPVAIGFVELKEAPCGGENPPLDEATFWGDNLSVVSMLSWDNLLFGPEGVDEIAETRAHAILFGGGEEARTVDGVVCFSKV